MKNKLTNSVSCKSFVTATLLSSASLLTLMTSAQAQEMPSAPTDQAADDVVVITGIRSSLKKSQDLKRDNDIIGDSITADDIGALPDRSVSEALQRVPGISINYFNVGNDSNRYAAEGTGVTLRGLTGFARSEFNGRDAFSVSGGRSLSFEAVPSELLGGVDVIKSASADRIEGGVAGTINLRTRLPFDSKKRIIAFSAESSNGDLAKKDTPTYSVLYSDRWKTGIGEFGFLINFVNSELATRVDSVKVDAFLCRQDIRYFGPDALPILSPSPGAPGGIDYVSPSNELCNGLASPTAASASVAKGIYLPRGIGQQIANNERERQGGSMAAQWKSNDGTLVATFQYIQSDTKTAGVQRLLQTEMTSLGLPNGTQGDVYPQYGSKFVVDPSSGIVTEATLQGPYGFSADNLLGGGSLAQPARITNALGGGTAFGVNNLDGTRSLFTGNDTGFTAANFRTPFVGSKIMHYRQDQDTFQSTRDASFNLKWNPSDSFKFSLDYQHVEGDAKQRDYRLGIASFEAVSYKLNGKDVPTISFVPTAPQAVDGYAANIVNRSTGQLNCGPGSPLVTIPATTLANGTVQPAIPNQTRPCPLVNSAANPSPTDPFNNFWRDSLENYSDSDGKSDALRLDGEYKFEDNNFVKNIAFGVRTVTREQTTRNTGYRFTTLSETFGGQRPGGPVFLDESLGWANSTAPGVFKTDLKSSDHYELYKFDNFFGGETADATGGQGRLFSSINGATEVAKYNALVYSVGQTWTPSVNPYTGAPQNRNNCTSIIPAGERNPTYFEPSNGRTLGARCGVILGTEFLPTEINEVAETTNSAYVAVRYQTEFANEMRLSGNVGLRYVGTSRDVQGTNFFGSPGGGNLTDAACDTLASQVTSTTAFYTPSYFCSLTPAERQKLRNFRDGGGEEVKRAASYRNLLPSFNAKLDITRDLVLRMGLSRNITPFSFTSLAASNAYSPVEPSATNPTVNGETLNYRYVGQRFYAPGATTPFVANNAANNTSITGTGLNTLTANLLPGQPVPVGTQFGCTRATSGAPLLNCTTEVTPVNTVSNVDNMYGTVNLGRGPELKPAYSNNYDLSLEWYFSPKGKVGSLTLALFKKDFYGLTTNKTELRPITNNGQTINFYVNETVNSPAKGNVKGYELSYQQTYDFLPGAFGGLGINANYTRVNSRGVPGLGSGGPTNTIDRAAIITAVLPLTGLSKNNANFIVFYEKYGLSARASYSYRSDFMLTTASSNQPNQPVKQLGGGQLDASIFYNLTKNVKIGVQGVNLDNKITRTNVIINNDLDEAPLSWFKADKRINFIVRATF
jgi:TonB-dependent receptor